MENQVWKRFINGETRALTQLPSKVANSWKFCLQNQVDPFLVKPPKMLSQSDLLVKQQTYRELIQTTKRELDQLDKRFQLQNPLFILTDEEGNILWRTGNYQARDFANEIDFKEGSNWSELEVGTNAIGLALRTKEDEYLSLEDHYSSASRRWSCAASPILDENNELIGVLDVSTYQNTSAKDSLLLLTMLTQKIANQLMKVHLQLRNQLLSYAQHYLEEVIFCDAHYRILQVPTKDARQFPIGEDIRKVIAPHLIYDQETIVENHQLLGYKYKVYQTEQKAETAEPIHVYPGVPTKNKAYEVFLEQVYQVAASQVPIHIFGESGSGKEVISQTIHFNSPVASGPLVAVNCGAVNENLLESELFGYAPGAFTGANAKGFNGKIAQADGGTLFLDEIDSMPEKMQKALLRVLEDKMVTPLSGKPVPADFRLVTASNKDLKELVRAGKFREDLFYRLFVCTVKIPPLRERLEDLEPLIERFVTKNQWAIAWQPQILAVAKEYQWYGNIREFNNFLARLAIFYPVTEPTKYEMKQLIQSGAIHQVAETVPASNQPKTAISEKEKIQQALVDSHFNMTKTAKNLAISRATLYRKMKKYELSV